jgi:pimeloyl-ACP methyl ester carboxylesterase
VEALAGEIREVIARHQAEMALVSPHGNLGALQVPTLLLHGTTDNVIPSSELLWLQREVPPAALKAALISPAIGHVELEKEPSRTDQWKLVHFMAQILELAEDSEPEPVPNSARFRTAIPFDG